MQRCSSREHQYSGDVLSLIAVDGEAICVPPRSSGLRFHGERSKISKFEAESVSVRAREKAAKNDSLNPTSSVQSTCSLAPN